MTVCSPVKCRPVEGSGRLRGSRSAPASVGCFLLRCQPAVILRRPELLAAAWRSFAVSPRKPVACRLQWLFSLARTCSFSGEQQLGFTAKSERSQLGLGLRPQ